MNCKKCGFENDEGARFCENCGSLLARVCSSCGSPLKQESRFCKDCGTPAAFPPTSKYDKDRLSIDRLASLQQSAPLELQERIRSISRNIEGERKPVTILFTDIVGSTSLAERLDPEEWAEIVSGAHQRVSQAVYHYEGTIAQLLGDGVLAFFGAPITHEDDPIRAVNAALDIQYSIENYAHDLRRYAEDFQMRVGLNTGTVVVGSVGSDMHLEYLALGDAVNLAARLQSSAKPGTVLISESTARLVKAAFNLNCLGEISLKGKSEAVTAFEVLERKQAPESKRGFEGFYSPLVGREAELGALRSSLDALAAGHGQVVAVIGEAGIGKSRLIEETRNENSGECQGLHWIEGRALSYGGTFAFWSISQMIKNDLGLSDGDPEPRIRLALRRRLIYLLGEKADEHLPYLAHLLGAGLEDGQAERIQALDGETLKRQRMIAITQYFTRLAELQPTVAVFEDLHWADPSSLEAINKLLPVTDRVPIMLLLVSRLEREHGAWRIKLTAETDYAHRYTEIQLKPLSECEQNHLIKNLLGNYSALGELGGQILERAEGNPFYLEEIMRSLIEQGALQQVGETWQASGSAANQEVPDTLQGILLARIDRLPEDLRRTLQIASVIGRSFLYRLLEAVTEDPRSLDQHLAKLQRADLLREKIRLPELEYMFKNSLIQEAAYNSLLIERRREFHHKVGEALESLFAERKLEFSGLLAHHFAAAGDREKAVSYLIQAGDKARLGDELSEAIGFYQNAIKLLEELNDEERLFQIWLKLGLVYHINFQFEAARLANEKAFSFHQKTRQQQKLSAEVYRGVLRLGLITTQASLDPGRVNVIQDSQVISSLFSGLVKIDADLNLVPDIAHSWQVLEGGKHYLFHLRKDALWTDGIAVTAHDFEWAWKRNLSPSFQAEEAALLYDVVGAQDFNQGVVQDPNSVWVRALDAYTLEVRVTEAVAYFPFIVSLPITFPLRRDAINQFGESWWMPKQIISNGPFRLVRYDAGKAIILERNPSYYGEYPGNVQRLEFHTFGDRVKRRQAYLEDHIDLTTLSISDIPVDLAIEEQQPVKLLYLSHLLFNPCIPPFDDSRVRKALSLALDRNRTIEQLGIKLVRGGLIPPGMPGHSPELGAVFDLHAAKILLAEAGYPEGHGFPEVIGLNVIEYWDIGEFENQIVAEVTRQWRGNLGIEVEFKSIDLRDYKENKPTASMLRVCWIADYPDPDNFLGLSGILSDLWNAGWRDPDYDELIRKATRTTDRAKRMAMYRQADRFLVEEQTLLLPLSYSLGNSAILVKPWVKNYKTTALGLERFQEVIIQEH